MEALIGLGGVVVGALIAGLSNWFSSKAMADREDRRLDRIRSELEKDRRDAFQRETLVELQDLLDSLMTAGHRLHLLLWRKMGSAEEVTEEVSSALFRLRRLESRVSDPEIGDIATKVGDHLAAIPTAASEDTALWRGELMRRGGRLNEAIGRRLRQDNEAPERSDTGTIAPQPPQRPSGPGTPAL